MLNFPVALFEVHDDRAAVQPVGRAESRDPCIRPPAEILRDLAATVAATPVQDVAHRETLADAAKALHRALAAAA